MRHNGSFSRQMQYLACLTADVVEQSRVPAGGCVGPHGPNVTPGTLIRPGGREAYAAFWIRDLAMSLESGLVTADELQHAVLLATQLQAREDGQTRTGSRVPRGSIADHISLSGTPIYFPGTLDDAEHQGDPWGKLPPFDNQFFFIHMAWYLAVIYRRSHCLMAEVDGLPLLACLELAFDTPPARPDTALVWCETGNRGVSFGFVDTVVHTGDLLFSSLLKYRATRQMSQLYALCHRREQARHYDEIAECLCVNLFPRFGRDHGLLRASTDGSAQADVWGSAFAVYTGALPEPQTEWVCRALYRGYRAGTLAWKGHIRHVPTDGDFDSRTAWEQLVRPYAKNIYQNGAYWGTPTGWVCVALARHHEDAARALASEFIAALEADDFRRGPTHGAPFECLHPDHDYRRNPVYMTSVTCPLAGFRRLGWLPS